MAAQIVICRDCGYQVSHEITEPGDDQPYFWCGKCSNRFSPYDRQYMANSSKYDPVKDVSRVDIVDPDLYYNSRMSPARRVLRFTRVTLPKRLYRKGFIKRKY